jgi:cytochrome c556
MKRALIGGVTGLAVLLCFAMHGNAKPGEALKTFMRVKLVHAQKTIEGLVEEDYDKIAKNSQEMSLLTMAATWQVLTTADYLKYSREFREAADKLTEAAKKKDLEKSTKAFNDVTTRCVECHKYVRGVKIARASTD